MSDATLDDRGRLTLPKEVRERYGDGYHIVQLRDGVKLIPYAEDSLEVLREEFADVDKTAHELREGHARRRWTRRDAEARQDWAPNVRGNGLPPRPRQGRGLAQWRSRDRVPGAPGRTLDVALHLVESDGETIVSSDETYASFAPLLDLKNVDDG